MSSIDEIKSRLDIVDLVSETVNLRRTGKNYIGFCPFHANTRTPAFVVFPESGTWRCFGQCNEGGDIFRFVMKKEGWDFSETLRFLADKAGVQLRPQTSREVEMEEEYGRLRALLEDTVTFYRHQLLHTPAGQGGLEYLHHRGLKDETIEAFGLGYAPNAWDATLSYFKGKGFRETELHDAGLVSERESGGYYDRFRNRIMFPIRDERGRMAGFGARILDPEDVPKFLNSPQTVLFEKGQLLYGLDRARRSIRSTDQAVIVEGYLDVIALHQAGFTNAVSPMGTALTEHQMRLLKRFTRRIVLALDPDAAGDKATLRGLEVARQSLDREVEPVFDARGLLGHESRLQADIRVTTLPQGVDPDEVVMQDAAAWERIVSEARPVVIHVMEMLAAGRDVEDPKVKSEIAGQVLPLIREVPDSVEREAYRQRLARLLRLDERAFQEDLPLRSGRPARRRAPQQAVLPAEKPPGGAPTGRSAIEMHCMGILMRRPDLVYRVDRAMQESALPRISHEDFDHTEYQAIFDLVQKSLEQDISEPLSYVLNSLSLPLMEMADDVLKQTQQLDPNDERVLEDLMRSVLDLRRREINRNIDHLRFLIQAAQQEGDLQVSEYSSSMKQFSQVRNLIDKALGKFTSRLAVAH
ncbi:MAG: DNA primase [Anaerolineales bacterium]|nr:DNA primase [Anaerolineales bacterium]